MSRPLRFTFSGLGRAIECPASLVLPQSSVSTPFASHGRVIHEYLERVRSMGPEKALAFVPAEHKAAAVSLDLENPALALEPGAYAAEVAFGFDTVTGEARELGRGMGRDYSSARPTEVCGTADLVGVTDDAVVIIDYKTGWTDLGPLWANWQLRGYALCAARAFNRKRAILIIVRVKDDGDAYQTSPEELSELDLELVAAEIALLVDKQAELEQLLTAKGVDALPTAQGPWCRYCPAFDRCPSKLGLIQAALGGDVGTLGEGLPEEAWSIAVERLEQLETIAKHLRQNLETRAKGAPISLANGYVFGTCRKPRRFIDAQGGLPLLHELVGADVDKYIEARLPLRALASACAPVVRGRKDPQTGRRISPGRYADEVFAQLAEAGYAKTAYSYPVMRHKPRPADLGGGAFEEAQGIEEASEGAG